MSDQDDLLPDGTRRPRLMHTMQDGFDIYDIAIKERDKEWQDYAEQVKNYTASLEEELDYYKNITASESSDSDSIDKSLYYVHAKDVELDLETSDFVQGLLGNGQLSVIYGESNCGKTFFMTDLAFHVALGKKWRDRRVDQGGVVYTALEGSIGLKKRISAFKLHNNIIPDGFVVVPCHVNFMDPAGNINEFVRLLQKAKQEIGSLKLVVIDTLARAISGGDENSGQDMGMLVKHADMIRTATGAHVCFIHHSGKDKLRGARGHSSLRAAVDTEIEIERSEVAQYSMVKVVKQREMEMSKDMAFSLKSIVLGINSHMETVTSCVVEPCEPDQKSEKKRNILTAHEKFVYDCLQNALIDRGVMRSPGKGISEVLCVDYMDLTNALEQGGYKELYNKDGTIKTKDATNMVRMSLRDKGYIGSNTRYIWSIGEWE